MEEAAPAAPEASCASAKNTGVLERKELMRFMTSVSVMSLKSLGRVDTSNGADVRDVRGHWSAADETGYLWM